jgi:hypothetical protein
MMLFMIGIGACTIAFYFAQTVRNSREGVSYRSTIPAPTWEFNQTPQSIKQDKLDKIIYPYSVIPGGVRSRQELADSIHGDKVIADHFAGFQISQARIVNVEETKFVHVSYRIRDKIYWTAKTIKLSKGETLITDGQNLARTRCGNRVSITPQLPISPKIEPPVEIFDTPQLARLRMPELLALESGLEVHPVPPLEPFVPVPRPKIPPYYYRPFFAVRQNNPVVPEPSSLGLLAFGIAVIAAIRTSWKK